MTKPSKGNPKISKKTKGLKQENPETVESLSEEHESMSQEFLGLVGTQLESVHIREEAPRSLNDVEMPIIETEGIDPMTLHDHKKHHEMRTL